MQITFTDMEYGNRKKKTRKEEFFAKMETVVPWEEIIKIIAPIYETAANKHGGRPRIPLQIMLRMYLVQNWFSLSDPATEDEIYDSYAMRNFVGINYIGKSQCPDETSLCNFRHLIEEHKIGEQIEKLILKKLEISGLIMRGGTILDATIMSAPKSTKNLDKTRDPEMKSTKKGTNYYFGSKLHIGVDAGTGYIHSHETTAANEHDITQAHKLIRQDDEFVSGDSAFVGLEKREEIASNPILANKKYEIVARPSRYKKFKGFLGETVGKVWEKKIEKPIISRRQKVEYAFLIIKNIFRYRKNPYKGIAKNDNKNALMCALANIYMVAQTGRAFLPFTG
jgi:IS5 family transposase